MTDFIPSQFALVSFTMDAEQQVSWPLIAGWEELTAQSYCSWS